MTRASIVDSQQDLAASIARAIELGLPGKDVDEGLPEFVKAALVAEARRTELSLAYLRVGFLAALTLLNFIVYFPASVLHVPGYPGGNAVVGVAWLSGATVLALALRRGWYRSWLRRIVPATDALMIVIAFVLLSRGIGSAFEQFEVGIVGATAVACVILAFSGALRLSRRAARLTTGFALVAWLSVAALANIGAIALFMIGAMIVTSGILGARFTRIVRKVVTNEVARLRLARMYEDAHHAVEAREEVLRIVSHDLRNPLATIDMSAAMMLETSTTDEQRARYLGIIRRSGERMNRLIHDLLDVARMEAGTLSILRKRAGVQDLLTEVTDMMQPLAQEKSVVLQTVCPDDLPPISVDPERTIQVFSNLVGNAIKFTPPGGHILLKADRLGDKVRLAVADDGAGIPDEDLRHIFGRFWQARTADRRGIGLGLTIAKSIVEAHGERIGAESKIGQGTEFWFTAQQWSDEETPLAVADNGRRLRADLAAKNPEPGPTSPSTRPQDS